MSVVQEVKSKLDIVQYIGQYVPLKKAGRNYKAPCPFHSERTPSFMVNPESQTWRCFGACAEGGDIYSFAMKHHGWSFGEALRELGALANVEIRKQTPQEKERYERLDRLRGMMQIAAEYFHEQLLDDSNPDAQATLEYVTNKRGFNQEMIKHFQLGFAPKGWDNVLNYLKTLGYSQEEILEVGLATQNEDKAIYDRFRYRFIIPICDDRGRVIAFGARALGSDEQAKYINSPQTPLFDKSRVLFGLDKAKRSIRDSETAIIAEGYLDVIQAHQAGYTNVVAQMGTAMTENQLQLVVPRYAKSIILALDADEAGQNAMRRSLEVARQALVNDYAGRFAIDVRVLQIPNGKDPDDFIRETPGAWEPTVANAESVADFVIAMETQDLPTDVSQVPVSKRELLARQILPLLVASEKTAYQQANLQKLALRLRIAEKTLLTWAREEQELAQRLAKPSPAREEPPPRVYYDDASAPPEQINQVTEESSQPPIGREAYAMESACLRLLLQDPENLYHINRKFRELAQNEAELLGGPLADFSSADFVHSGYRALVPVLYDALAQDDQEPLDYIRENVDGALQSEYDALLADDLARHTRRLRHRYSGDLPQIYQTNNRRRIESPQNLVHDLVSKALALRSRRLETEREDLRFLQMDPTQDLNERNHLSQQLMLSTRANHRIYVELKEINTSIY